jgi:hypothetical protein
MFRHRTVASCFLCAVQNEGVPLAPACAKLVADGW